MTRDAAVSSATAYPYRYEANDAIDARAPELPDVLTQILQQRWPSCAWTAP